MNKKWSIARARQRFADLIEATAREPQPIYRRNRMVSLPVSCYGGESPDGVPHVAPEVTLLCKAKRTGKKDERDFRIAVGAMSGEARIRLRRALATAHPDHDWLDILSSPVLPNLPPPSVP